MTALVARLAFIAQASVAVAAVAAVALVARLPFVAPLAVYAWSDPFFQFFDLDQDFVLDLFVIHMFVNVTL